jgi:hypothetical protein
MQCRGLQLTVRCKMGDDGDNEVNMGIVEIIIGESEKK